VLDGAVLADIDFDGGVGFSDFLTLSRNFGSEGNYSDGDIACDGVVSFTDFLTLAAEFGSTAAAASVPEPLGNVWIVTACYGCLLRLCRRNKEERNRSTLYSDG
jgi:hypothetical protein